jgi:hypothetical protein
MVKSRFRRKLDRNFRNVIITIMMFPPLSFFTISRFSRSHVIVHMKKQKTITDEVSIDNEVMHWSVTEYDRITKERVIKKEIYKNDMKMHYKHFITLLREANFFRALADTHYESAPWPVTESTTEYEFILSWKRSGKVIYSVELIDNSNYGLSDEDREKFGIVEEYLKELTEGDGKVQENTQR